MSGEVIKYSSPEASSEALYNDFSVGKGSSGCLNWQCKAFVDQEVGSPGTKDDSLFLAWKFEWDTLRDPNLIGYKGHIIASYRANERSEAWNRRSASQQISTRFDVELKQSGKFIEKKLNEESNKVRASGWINFKYQFELTPIYKETEKRNLSECLASLTLTDGVLLIEGNKVHVNKTFLAFQSEYFNTLFNSDFKEKNIAEIAIKDVAYDDFLLMLSVIHPNPIPPTDATAPKLLELANRFLLPAVSCHVESYLLSSSLETVDKLSLGDKYNLSRLIESSVLQLGTRRVLDRITRSVLFDGFSKDTQTKILQRFLCVD